MIRGATPTAPHMGRRPKIVKYKDLKGLEDERKLRQMMAVVENRGRSDFSITENIPGTVPEKIVYDYLVKLKVNFNFQYHIPENYGTANTEGIWIPDFILPDYNNTIIEVYGTYFHTIRRASDQLKKIYWQLAGYTIVEKGIPLSPPRNSNGGKVVIWWENEIYNSLGFLFDRDLPELFIYHMPGRPGPYMLDPEQQFRKLVTMRKRLASSRVRPKYVPRSPSIKKLRIK